MSDMKYFDGTKWITLKGEDGCDPIVTAMVNKTVTLPAGQNALAKVNVVGLQCEPEFRFEFSIPRGADGIGTDGEDGEDGKGWTGGGYNASTGIVTFTSDDGLGFSTGDLRGKDGVGTKGDKGDGWTGGSYNASDGIVTFTSSDGLGFTTGDLRGSDGVGTKGDDGTSVDLTTVSVDTADCSVTPDSSSGAFVSDVDGADGTKQYKLDLKLPRPPVVTTSDTEPTAASSCDGDFWVDESEGDDTGGGDGTVPIQTGGRLSLEQNNSVMVDDVVSGTIFYVPFSGDTVSVLSGSVWKATRLTGSVALSVATLAANTVHDIFLSNDGTGWLMNAVAWSSDTTRTANLNMVDGILVKSGSNSERYVGTIRTNGSGQVEAKAINYCIWNAYNQRVVNIHTRWNQTWTYATGTWTSYGNNSVNGQARVSFVCGLRIDVQMTSNQTSRYAYTGVSLGSIAGKGYPGTPGYVGSTGMSATSPAFASAVAEIGYNYVQSCVYGNGGSTLLTECETRGSFLA